MHDFMREFKRRSIFARSECSQLGLSEGFPGLDRLTAPLTAIRFMLSLRKYSSRLMTFGDAQQLLATQLSYALLFVNQKQSRKLQFDKWVFCLDESHSRIIITGSFNLADTHPLGPFERRAPTLFTLSQRYT
jgi:hypothetical protein